MGQGQVVVAVSDVVTSLAGKPGHHVSLRITGNSMVKPEFPLSNS